MNKKFLSAILFGALAVSAGSFVSCKDYDDDIDNLRKEIANMSSIKADASALSSAIDAAKAALQSDIKSAAQQAVADAKAQALEEAKKEIAKIETGASMEEVQTAISNAIAKINACNCDVDGKIAAAVANLVKSADMEAALSTLEQKIKTDMAALYLQQDALNGYAKLTDVTAAVTAAQTAVTAAIETAKTAATTEAVAAAKEAAATEVAKVDASLNLLAPVRLTSMVFAPKTYINGIEAIKFANQKYKTFTDRKKSAPNGTDATLATVGASAEYHVSPANTAIETIKALDFLCNTASNTRAGEPLVTTDLATAKIEAGVLKLQLKKNGTANWGTPSHISDGNSTENFNIIALKATLKDEVKTADEKKNNAEVAVFSDWARIVETWTTPIIDSKEYNTPTAHTGHAAWDYVDANRNTTATGAHFWNYDAVYPLVGAVRLGETKGNPNLTDHNKYITKHVSYKESIDLNTLTQVCTYTGVAGVDATLNDDPKTAAALGLTFSYELVDYWYKNEGITADATNQKLFAKLDGSILSSCAENGLPMNADACGRTPVICAKLMDGDKIVDVVYFKIQWDEVTIPNTYKTADPAVLEPIGFKCAPGIYSQFVGEVYMNNLYASMLDNAGMTRNQFHAAFPNILTKGTYAATDYDWTATYTGKLSDGTTAVLPTQQGDLFLGKVDAAAEAAVKDGNMAAYTVVGFVSDLDDNAALTQTHNIEIAAAAAKINPTAEADFEADAFFAYKSGDGKSYVIVPVKVVVKKGAYTLVYNYLETQWENAPLTTANINKTRPVNPAIVSDSKIGFDGLNGNATSCYTTQLIGDFTYGYMKNSLNPTNIADLYNYASTSETQNSVADVVFDDTRIAEMAAQNGTAATDWEVKAAGKELWYKKVTPAVKAAEISGNKVYLIDNQAEVITIPNAAAADAEPTKGALLLVWEKGVQEVFVPVVVKSTFCYKPVLDQYRLRFVQPLEVKVKDGGIVLSDVLNYGSADAVTLADQLTLKEAFGSKETIYLFTPYPAGVDAVKNDRLIKWYEISGIAVDLPKAKINITANGALTTNVAEYTDLVANKNASSEYLYELVGVDKFGNEITINDIIGTPAKAADVVKIFYHNNSGQAITQNLEILVPVNLDTKWKKNVGASKYIKVTVKPNI